MSGEMEAAGAAATAGLAAHAIEGRSGTRHGEGVCLNCDAVASGRYCAQCGQPTHVARTLGHVVEEFLHGLIHFDTKAWRTLPLLAFRPGTLTHDYIHGRRARYISPLAMFLFTIFLMFFVFSLTGGPNIGAQTVPDRAATRAELGEVRVNVRAAREEIAGRAPAAAEALARVDDRLARAEQGAREEGQASIPTIGVGARDDVVIGEAGSGGRWQDELREAVERGDLTVQLGNDYINDRVREHLLNPDLALYRIQQAAYKFSFLLVPITLPFIALLFLWRRGVTLFDHVVFSLYSLSFMSVLFMATAILVRVAPMLTPDSALPLLTLIPPVHMFFHLGGTYRLGWFSALWRTLLLALFVLFALALFAAFVLIVGLVG